MRYLTGLFFLGFSVVVVTGRQIVVVVVGATVVVVVAPVSVVDVAGVVVVVVGGTVVVLGVQVGLVFFTVVVVAGGRTGLLRALGAHRERDRGVPADAGARRPATGAGRRSTYRSNSLVRGSRKNSCARSMTA